MRIALLAALGLSFAAVPSAVRAETLVDALTSAYANNTDLAAARARLRVTDEQVPQALAGWRPTVNLNPQAAYQSSSFSSGPLLPTPLGYRQWAYGATLKLDMPLYQGGRTSADVKRAEENVRAGRADLLGSEENVLLEAANAYIDVLRTRTLLKTNRELETLLEQRARETAIRMEAGQLTHTDVLQAQNRLAGARATRIGSEGDVAAAEARYLAAVGRPPPPDLAEPRQPPGLPANAGEAARLAEENNPTVIASNYRLNAARQQIAVARADLLPNVSLSVQASQDKGLSVPLSPAHAYSATVNATVPLYQSGASASRVRQARESASESRIQVWTSLRDAKKNAETAFAQWRAAVEREIEQGEQVRLGQHAYEDVQKEAALGARSTFEMLGQLQDFYNARVSEITARYEVPTRAYQLLVATGRFTAADLNLPVALYDPEAHYRKVRDKDGTILPWLKALREPPAEGEPAAKPQAKSAAAPKTAVAK